MNCFQSYKIDIIKGVVKCIGYRTKKQQLKYYMDKIKELKGLI